MIRWGIIVNVECLEGGIMVLRILKADRCLWLDVAPIGRLARNAGATARLA